MKKRISTLSLVLALAAALCSGIPASYSMVGVPRCSQHGLFRLIEQVHERSAKTVILDTDAWDQLDDLDESLSTLLELAKEKEEKIQELTVPEDLVIGGEFNEVLEDTVFTVKGLSLVENYLLSKVKATGSNLQSKCKTAFDNFGRGSPGDLPNPSSSEELRQLVQLAEFLGMESLILMATKKGNHVRSLDGGYILTKRDTSSSVANAAGAKLSSANNFLIFEGKLDLSTLDIVASAKSYSALCFGSSGNELIFTEEEKIHFADALALLSRDVTKFQSHIKEVRAWVANLPNVTSVVTTIEMQLEVSNTLKLLRYLAMDLAEPDFWVTVNHDDLEKMEDIREYMDRIQDSLYVTDGVLYTTTDSVSLQSQTLGRLTEVNDVSIYGQPAVAFRPTARLTDGGKILGSILEPSVDSSSLVHIFRVEPFLSDGSVVNVKYLVTKGKDGYAMNEPPALENCIESIKQEVCEVSFPRSYSKTCATQLINQESTGTCGTKEMTKVQVFPAAECGLAGDDLLLLANSDMTLSASCRGKEDLFFYLKAGRSRLEGIAACRLVWEEESTTIYEGRDKSEDPALITPINEDERETLEELFALVTPEEGGTPTELEEAFASTPFLVLFVTATSVFSVMLLGILGFLCRRCHGSEQCSICRISNCCSCTRAQNESWYGQRIFLKKRGAAAGGQHQEEGEVIAL